MTPTDRPIVTRSRLAAELKALGVRRGAVVMVHARMSALGWVVGGAQTVIEALLDVVGEEGTLMAYIGWEDEPPQPLDALPDEALAAVLAEHPAYDPRRARAARDHGRVPEALRTWPGAVHSGHPEAGIAAVGLSAAYLAHPHQLDEGYGAGTPYARLVEMGGQVVHIGSPLDTTTLIHHAETIARIPGKAQVTYDYPVRDEQGQRVWRQVHDIDTSEGALPYDRITPVPYVEHLATLALRAGAGRSGPLGGGVGHCLDAARLVEVAVAWIERSFGVPAAPAAALE